ncbi:hypothetical protein L9F63_006547, partial [Diploptera punctata]
MELVGPKGRVFAGTIISVFYTVGEVILGGVAMWLQNWRLILRTVYIPALFCILHYWLASESVRWLLTKGRNKEASEILLKAAKTNEVILPQHMIKKIRHSGANKHQYVKEEIEKGKKGTFLQILASKILLKRLINSAFCWFTITFVFFGLSLNSVSVGGNKYTNFIMVALIELPAYVIFYICMDRIGRKKTLCASLILSGISCMAFAFLPTDMNIVQLILFLMGKFGITISFAVVFVFTAELFPTELRHSMLATCSMLGRIGSVIAPQTPLLEIYFKSLPLLLFGTMSLLTTMDLDEILDELQHFGKFQTTNYLLLSMAILFAALFEASFIFTAGNLDYRYTMYIPECDGDDTRYRPSWLENAVPFYDRDAQKVPEPCLRFEPQNFSLVTLELSMNYSLFKCQEWVYDGEETTILKEWNLTCEDNYWKLTMVGTVDNIGQFVGLSIVGLISDRIGRKTTLIVSMILSCLMGLARSFAWSYEIFLVFEFLDPALGTGIYTSALVLGMELVGSRSRVLAATLITSFYAVGQALTGLIAWWLQDWRKILQVSYLPSLLCISYYWLIPESVRWLLTKGRTKEATEIILRAAKTNGVTLSERVMRKMRDHSAEKAEHETIDENDQPLQGAIYQVFKSKILLPRLVISIICWMSIMFVYFGLTINSVSVGSNKYTSFILGALIELPAYVATYILMNKFGRKFSLSAALILSGISCTSFGFLPP